MRTPTGITRKVTFTAWCHDCPLGWAGEPREMKSMAAMDLTFHTLDKHGGAARGEDPK